MSVVCVLMQVEKNCFQKLVPVAMYWIKKQPLSKHLIKEYPRGMRLFSLNRLFKVLLKLVVALMLKS